MILTKTNKESGTKIPKKEDLIPITFSREAYEEICHALTSQPVESGGMCMGNVCGEHVAIAKFINDFSAATTSCSYTPDRKIMSDKIGAARKRNLEPVLMVHTHPYGYPVYTSADEEYAKEIVHEFDLPFYDIGVGVIGKDKKLSLRFFRVYPDETGKPTKEVKYEVVDERITYLSEDDEREYERITKDKFKNTKYAIDNEVMQRKTVIGIGCGGAMGLYVDLARCGVKNFVLFDHDYYQDTNISNQFADVPNLGRGKVQAAWDKIHDVYPSASVTSIQRKLDNNISDDEFAELVGKEILERPTDYLITAFTDDFFAQARAAALAVKYGTPFISAQMYPNGDSAEVSFTYPGVTASCPRCMIEPRYKAYKKGFKNNVTSSNSTIFSTQRINAICGQIALMLLQYGAEDGRYRKILKRIADRNFIQVKITPFDTTLQEDLVNDAFRKDFAFCDSSIWIKQTHEQNCPLCGGFGNLLKSRDRIKDTRRNLV